MNQKPASLKEVAEMAKKACQLFASRVRALEIADEVRCTEDEDHITAWVITSGPVFDFESNKPIYEAALEAMRFQEGPAFDFRIINVNELKEDVSIEDILPAQAEVIWKRQGAN